MSANILRWAYILISPAYFYASYIVIFGYPSDRMGVWLNRIFALPAILILLVFVSYPIYLLIKNEVLKSLSFVVVQLVVFLAFKAALNANDIDDERINFLANEDRYFSMIKHAIPHRPGKNIYLIKIKPRYVYCERYLVHDETGEFLDPKSDFLGIGRIYATTEDGERFHSGNIDVRVRKFGDYTYIADTCSSIVSSL